MRMTMNVNKSMVLKNMWDLSAMIAYWCSCATLINTDLNFIHRTKYRTFSTHS